MSKKKASLIYIADPMCSWCYGFAEEISKLKNKLKDNVDFHLIMGGLRPYNTQKITEIAAMLKEHWQHVEERSGQSFNYSILENNQIIYDTEPASRAVILVRKLSPKQEFDFFKAVQQSFYSDNKDPNLIQTYLDLAAKFELDQKQFKTEFESEELKELTHADFDLAGSMGVRGFPSVVLKEDDKLSLVSYGYSTLDKMLARISI